MTDYLTRLLQEHDDLWQPDAADGLILLRSAAARTERQSAAHRAPSAEAAWRDARAQSAEMLLGTALTEAAQAQLAASRLMTLREAHLAAAPRAETVRTGQTGSPSDPQPTVPSEQTALSMAAISRYFERDARRYG